MAFIEIPEVLGFEKKVFDLSYKQQINPEGSGFIQTLDRATPAWYAEFTTPPLAGEKLGIAQAFIDSLEGALNSFQAYDPGRIMPYAYRGLSVLSDPWTQTGQTAPRVTARDYANSTLTIDRLENGAIITKGDLISFHDGVAWHLYRSAADAVVSGNAVILAVKPRPMPINTLPSNIRYRKACFEAKIIGGVKWEGSVSTPDSLSFKAVQFINRAA